MALTVRFFKNVNKKTNSTFQPSESNPSNYVDYTCTLKDGTSILDPVLDIYMSMTDNPASLGLNYCKVSAFNRYYFVRDWKYALGVWTASCSVDVLASYKTEIGSLTKYVNRSASEYTSNLTDTIYPSVATPEVSYVFSDNPFRVNPFGSYIVGIIGTSQANVPNIGGINYYLFTASQMSEFIDYLMGSTMAGIMADPSEGLSTTVVKAITNPLDYISSCIWFPFEITGVTTAAKVQPKLGWWDNITPISGTGLTPLGGGQMDSLKFTPGGTWSNSMTIPSHPQAATRGSWLDGSPNSNYTFHLDPWGDIPLDPQEIINEKTISYTINCEGISGMGILELYLAGTKLLTRRVAQVGVSISIAQIITDFASMSSSANLVSGAAAGVLSGSNKDRLGKALKDFFSFQTFKHAEGKKELGALLKGIGEDVASGVLAYNTDMSTTGMTGSIVSYMGTALAMAGNTVMYTQGAWIKIVRFNLVSEDNTDRGRPLCLNKQLSALSGYIECADSEHDVHALEGEKNMISAYLTGGFFYE